LYNNELEARAIPLTDIYLDPNNPRFTAVTAKVSDKRTVEPAVQQRTTTAIFREGVEELIGSILHNGFLPLDRIVVRELIDLDGKYVVVEGNRRLAALRGVQERIAGAELDETEFDEDMQATLSASIQTINCLVYTGSDTGDIAWILQGIRHISGIRDWTPAQRAELVSREIDEHGLKPRQVGQMLGITTQQVNRLYRANRGLSQMLTDDDYGARAKKEYFTLFEEAHQKQNVRKWLGWDPSTETYSNEANLHTFYDLISEDPNNQDRRRIHDPRQISSLDKIVAAERKDLLDQLNSYEISVDEAKGRLDESENQKNWQDQVERATKALDNIKATTLTSQSEVVLTALKKLQTIVTQLIQAASASAATSAAENAD
jgi:ParB-like nuclease domain